MRDDERTAPEGRKNFLRHSGANVPSPGGPRAGARGYILEPLRGCEESVGPSAPWYRGEGIRSLLVLVFVLPPRFNAAMNHARPSAGSPASARAAYDALIKELREISLLGSVGSVLGWDERTQLPAKGAGLRADQASMLARMVHERI